MHGEGNILAHLVILGHKVSYQQVYLLRLILCIMVISICTYIGTDVYCLSVCMCVHVFEGWCLVLCDMIGFDLAPMFMPLFFNDQALMK